MSRSFISAVLLIAFLQFVPGYMAAQNPYVIPVVFHILHMGGTENISDAQVLNAMHLLNDDYNKRNADTAFVSSAFKNNIANVGIEFRLANKDPQGNCTNGIEHIYSSQTFQGSDYSKINDWPRNQYLNIWVVKNAGGVGGYTRYPYAVDTLPALDGIIFVHNYIGSIGTAQAYNHPRDLTTAVAHYLNLFYTAGNNYTCGDDSVSDTPTTSFNVNCDSSHSVCNPPIIENVQNFMAGTHCGYMFTNGQKARMLACLNSSIAERNNLSTSSNLIATGTDNNNPSPCAPIADFSCPNRQLLCIGDNVKFIDNSYNGFITTRLWSFTNASISSSTDSMVTVSFNSPGWQTVTLTVSNSQGSSTVTKTLLFVKDTTVQIATPYYNSFEDPNDFAQNWAPFNIDGDQPAFQRYSYAGHTGRSSVLLNNFNSVTDGSMDELITPAFDCSNLNNTSAKLTLWLSAATRSTNLNISLLDSIIIYASKSCPPLWYKIYTNGTNSLLNAGTVTTSYAPVAEKDWQNITAIIPPSYRATNVTFRIIVWGAHNSNNLFIDDFIIGPQSTDIDEEWKQSLSIIPNPFTSNVVINGLAPGKYDFAVYDITGKVLLVANSVVSSQDEPLNLGLEQIQQAGIYFARIVGKDGATIIKIVKQ